MNAVGRLRIFSILDAISWILLAGIAVPLKHIWDIPIFVRVIGPIHGIFFCGFCLFLFQSMDKANWGFKTAGKVFLSAFIPFVPFFLDKWLKQEEKRVSEKTA